MNTVMYPMDTHYFKFENVAHLLTAGGSRIALVGDFRSTKGKTVNQTRMTKHETQNPQHEPRSTSFVFRAA